MTLRANFSGIVVDLCPVAGEAKGASIGLGAFWPLGVAVRAFGVVNIGVMGVRRWGGVAGRAGSVGGVMRLMALRAIGLGSLPPFGMAGVTGQTGMTCVWKRKLTRLGGIPNR